MPDAVSHAPACPECALARKRTFCVLPPDLRNAIQQIKVRTGYARGATVFSEAEACHSVFIVCEGSVKLITTSSTGKILLLRFARPGEVLGVAEAIRGGPYDCTAIAAEPIVLGVIPRATFLRFVTTYPEASVRLTEVLSEQYTFAQRETRFLGFGETSAARVARLLIDWSDTCGQHEPNGTRVVLQMTQTEIAQSIGSTRETVTRILSDLDERGIIERNARTILIRDREQLARLIV